MSVSPGPTYTALYTVAPRLPNTVYKQLCILEPQEPIIETVVIHFLLGGTPLPQKGAFALCSHLEITTLFCCFFFNCMSIFEIGVMRNPASPPRYPQTPLSAPLLCESLPLKWGIEPFLWMRRILTPAVHATQNCCVLVMYSETWVTRC